MNIRASIINVLSSLGLINLMTRLMRSQILGRPIRIVRAIWRSGDLPQSSGQAPTLGSSEAPVSGDFDSVIQGIEECLIRHENALRELESSIRRDNQ